MLPDGSRESPAFQETGLFADALDTGLDILAVWARAYVFATPYSSAAL